MNKPRQLCATIPTGVLKCYTYNNITSSLNTL